MLYYSQVGDSACSVFNSLNSCYFWLLAFRLCSHNLSFTSFYHTARRLKYYINCFHDFSFGLLTRSISSNFLLIHWICVRSRHFVTSSTSLSLLRKSHWNQTTNMYSLSYYNNQVHSNNPSLHRLDTAKHTIQSRYWIWAIIWTLYFVNRHVIQCLIS